MYSVLRCLYSVGNKITTTTKTTTAMTTTTTITTWGQVLPAAADDKAPGLVSLGHEQPYDLTGSSEHSDLSDVVAFQDIVSPIDVM